MLVTTGLDPAVHAEVPIVRQCPMDRRVKPGNDEEGQRPPLLADRQP
jgi:hypothetical protein